MRSFLRASGASRNVVLITVTRGRFLFGLMVEVGAWSEYVVPGGS